MSVARYSIALLCCPTFSLFAADPPAVFLIPDNAPFVADFGGRAPGSILNFSVAPGSGVTNLTAKVDNPGPDSWVVNGLSFTATVVNNVAGIHTGKMSGTYNKASPGTGGGQAGTPVALKWNGVGQAFTGAETIAFVDPLSTIPTDSRAVAKRCLCTNKVKVSTTPPTAGVAVNLTSTRAAGVDVFNASSGVTGTDGTFTADWKSRMEGTLQAITNYIHSDNYNVLPADYETAFLATVYIIASEADYPGPKAVNPKGLTGSYNLRFLRQVELQGTGQSDEGQYITIDYANSPTPISFQTVQFKVASSVQGKFGPITSTSIAADPNVIPGLASVLLLAGTITVPGGNTRIVSDTGGKINGYHIDIFAGFGKAAANGWNNPVIPIRLLAYGQ